MSSLHFFTYKCNKYQQEDLRRAFYAMKDGTAPISVFVGDKPSEPIFLDEGLAPNATKDISSLIPTIKGHVMSSMGKAESAPADELKEAIDE